MAVKSDATLTQSRKSLLKLTAFGKARSCYATHMKRSLAQPSPVLHADVCAFGCQPYFESLACEDPLESQNLRSRCESGISPYASLN